MPSTANVVLRGTEGSNPAPSSRESSANLIWTPDGLLRHIVYLGERADKPAIEMRRSPAHDEFG
jgi:hypothetical protein